ncbi:MAG: hypothetical protein K5622_00760 [Endomicrobiaceae bacterium]|nr:hypothetical protein [Endomicrobiaceae bacterium]
MLKKVFLFSLLLVLASTVSMAAINVDAEGKTQKYPDGSTLNVAAARNLFVEYYGVRVFVPKGEKLSLRCSAAEEDNNIFCSGNGFKNIKVGNSTLSTDKEAKFIISQNGEVKIESGSLVVRDKNDNVAILGAGSTYTIPVASLTEDSFINVSKQFENNYEQVLKDRVLSPSAPRN